MRFAPTALSVKLYVGQRPARTTFKVCGMKNRVLRMSDPMVSRVFSASEYVSVRGGGVSLSIRRGYLKLKIIFFNIARIFVKFSVGNAWRLGR